MKRLTVALVTALCSTTLLAAEKPYVGIDYQMGTYNLNNTDVNPEAFRLRAGTEINRYLAVEAQAGLGTASDTYKVTGGQVDIKVDSFYSLFLRPQLNLTNTVSVYGLVGEPILMFHLLLLSLPTTSRALPTPHLMAQV
ncbi:MAG: porin family protein [Moraxellaceae bacterium]|nr:porin family protein [Moraxellaceae bacterium]